VEKAEFLHIEEKTIMSNITANGDYHVSKIWIENFDNRQANIYKLPPYP
jgi:hypothetical protein